MNSTIATSTTPTGCPWRYPVIGLNRLNWPMRNPCCIAVGSPFPIRLSLQPPVQDAGGCGSRGWPNRVTCGSTTLTWENTDGYFVPHEMEVTKQITEKADHVLAVEATCRRFGDPDNRATLTGALQDPEIVGDGVPVVGGLWRPVTLWSSGLIAIRHTRVICADVRMGNKSHPTRARLALRAVLDVPDSSSPGSDIPDPTTVILRTRVADTEHIHEHPAAVGENRVEWTVNVDDPELWWPHALGEQVLHDLTLEVVTDSEVHDQRRFRIGFRKVMMRRLGDVCERGADPPQRRQPATNPALCWAPLQPPRW